MHAHNCPGFPYIKPFSDQFVLFNNEKSKIKKKKSMTMLLKFSNMWKIFKQMNTPLQSSTINHLP